MIPRRCNLTAHVIIGMIDDYDPEPCYGTVDLPLEYSIHETGRHMSVSGSVHSDLWPIIIVRAWLDRDCGRFEMKSSSCLKQSENDAMKQMEVERMKIVQNSPETDGQSL